ncbi:hypothetical protein PR048_030003 [Dryococelus australis]|uniref:TM7S3/TM198-like domain-containing protein n=1 Tax=Dryococelus australis TaxID=614101 RepID=A0ABQ9G7Q2_9NEOP|nr:hypothetical protein PR048_030003 [Dryococelus australis]
MREKTCLCKEFCLFSVNIVVSLVLGAILGAVWLFVWCFCGSPVLSVLLATLTLGFIFTATMFYAGIADYNFLQSDLNFWILFSSLMLIMSLLLIPSNMKANIVSCAVLGAYAFVIPVDHYIGSNLKYIIVNMIRRATVQDFKKAFINPVFQFKDLILTFTWIGLALTGVIVQCCQQRNRSPFPPPPFLKRRQRYRRSEMPIITPRHTESSPLLTGEDIPRRNRGTYESRQASYLPWSPSPDIPDSPNTLSKLRSYLSGLLPPTSSHFSEVPTAPYFSQYDSI